MPPCQNYFAHPLSRSSQVAASNLADFAPGTKFQPVLLDPDFLSYSSNPEPERIILCSGKIYYDLVAARKERGLDGKVMILRIEELAPFPWSPLKAALDMYLPSSKLTEVLWAQEEPKNQGPWPHVGVRLEAILEDLDAAGRRLKFVGRKESPVPAVTGKTFQKQKDEVLENAFVPFGTSND